MRKSRKSVPACVYILADHLDGALASGEDLINAGSFWPEGSASEPAISGAQRWALSRLRTHEMSLVTHLLQARKNALELARGATAFRASAHLFSSTLCDLDEIGEDFERESAVAFDVGVDMVSFLRERGLVASDAAGSLPCEPLTIDDQYLIAGKIPLGIVLDLVSEFLEALDIHYELYPDTTGETDDAHGIHQAA